MRLFIFIGILVFSSGLFAQNEPLSKDIDTTVYYEVDKKPVFSGCEDLEIEWEIVDCFGQSMREHVANHFSYPQDAQDNGIQGLVIVKLIVNTDGSVSDLEIVRSVYPSIDEEALRVMSLLPRMHQPAIKGGEPVRMSFNMPINAKIEKETDAVGPSTQQAEMVYKKRDTSQSAQFNMLYKDRDTTVFIVVEKNPVFPGCEHLKSEEKRTDCFTYSVFQHVSKHFKFPEEARNDNIQGVVVVSFIIEIDGSISNIKIVQGLCKSIEEEAMRVVRLLPTLQPAENGGVPVRRAYNLPIRTSINTLR